MDYRIETSSYDQNRSGIQSVRTQVFIQEQGIDSSLEWDEHDAEAVFAIAIDNSGQIVGTARLLSAGKIGRMAVLPNYRRQGVGTALLLHLLDIPERVAIRGLPCPPSKVWRNCIRNRALFR